MMKFTAEGKEKHKKINSYCKLQALKAPNFKFMLSELAWQSNFKC